MPNAGYVRGRALEYAIRDEALQAGCLVVRAAASKGIADLVVFAPRDFTPNGGWPPPVWAVNVKLLRWPGPAERLAAAAWYQHGVWPVAACKAGRRTWWRAITPTGGFTLMDAAPWCTP